MLGPISAHAGCGALAAASLGRPAFRRMLRVRYRLREAALVSVTVRRGGRVVRRRGVHAARGTHVLRLRGLRAGRYRVTVAAGAQRAALAAIRR